MAITPPGSPALHHHKPYASVKPKLCGVCWSPADEGRQESRWLLVMAIVRVVWVDGCQADSLPDLPAAASAAMRSTRLWLWWASAHRRERRQGRGHETCQHNAP